MILHKQKSGLPPTLEIRKHVLYIKIGGYHHDEPKFMTLPTVGHT